MKFKKQLKLGLVALLSVSVLSGCFPSEKEKGINTNADDFDTFVASLPTQFMSNDNINLEFLFEHPENFGFTPELLNLPYSTLEDYKQSEDETKELLKELETYNYESLDDSQKITYDILKDSLERGAGSDKYYYLDNSYLGSFIGYQAQLPLLLNEYTFESENDLNSYFNILEQSPEVFLKYAEIEKERQAHDSGMSKAILDKVISQCETFSKDENPFLIDVINKRIDAVSFLNEEQKSEAKQKNEKLLREAFVKAYLDLGNALKEIDAPSEEVGLAGQPNGKEYYEYLLKRTTGLDDSVEEIRTYLEKKQKSLMLEMQALMLRNPKVYEKIQTMDLSNATYSSFTTIEETIDYLGEQMKKDYPDVGTLNYDVTTVPDSMKDNFSPAAYLQGKIDAPKGSAEHIWINGEFSQGLFETLAHEGYPGHMYQHTYFIQQNLPTARYLIDYNGYSEGWATYVENNAWQYADVDEEQKDLLHLISLNSQYSKCIIGLFDIKIHYDGITFEEFVQEMKTAGFDLEEDTLKEQWYLNLETPTNYLQYYVTGFKYQDLQDDAKKELGDKYNSVKFNDALLKNGPAPFSIIEKEVNAYIDSAK